MSYCIFTHHDRVQLHLLSFLDEFVHLFDARLHGVDLHAKIHLRFLRFLRTHLQILLQLLDRVVEIIHDLFVFFFRDLLLSGSAEAGTQDSWGVVCNKYTPYTRDQE